MDGRNTIIAPLTMPGTESGSVILKKVVTPFAPRSAEASSRLLSILMSVV